MTSLHVPLEERSSPQDQQQHRGWRRQVAARAADAARKPRSLESVVLLSLPILVLGVLGWRRRWMSDDAFINVRVVENLFAGHGPVYNVGERVEVGTSTLWLVALSIGHALVPFVAISRLAVYGGLLATVLGLAAATAGAVVLWRMLGRRGSSLPLGAVVVAALPPFWDFATSGLETGLILLWLGLSFLLLARRLASVRRADGPRPPAWRPLAPAVVIGLGPLVRPDLVLIAAALGLALLAQSRFGFRSWAGAAGAALAIPAAYEVVRAGYYASLVPNTALAKGAGSSEWATGLHYLDDFAGRYDLVIPLLVLGLVLWGPSLAKVVGQKEVGIAALLAAPVLGGILHALFVVRVGGDFMHGRLLLPATFSILMPVAAVVAGPHVRDRLQALVPLLVVVPWSIVVAAELRPPYQGIGPRGIADERGYYVTASRKPNPMFVGDYTSTSFFRWFEFGTIDRGRAERGERLFVSVAGEYPVADGYRFVSRFGNIGIYGVVAGPSVFVADPLSLASAIGARLEVPPLPEARVGHAKVVPLVWDRARYARPSPDDPQEVVDARAALQCGDLAQLNEAIRAPMTPGRFLRNLRAAPRLTRLSIPYQPAEARTVFCRTG